MCLNVYLPTFAKNVAVSSSYITHLVQQGMIFNYYKSVKLGKEGLNFIIRNGLDLKFAIFTANNNIYITQFYLVMHVYTLTLKTRSTVKFLASRNKLSFNLLSAASTNS